MLFVTLIDARYGCAWTTLYDDIWDLNSLGTYNKAVHSGHEKWTLTVARAQWSFQLEFLIGYVPNKPDAVFGLLNIIRNNIYYIFIGWPNVLFPHMCDAHVDMLQRSNDLLDAEYDNILI